MFKLFRNLKKRDVLFISFCLVLTITQVFLELRIPDYMSTITRLVQTEGSKMGEILTNGLYMILCAFISFITAVLVGYFAANLASNFSATLRRKVFHKVCDFSDAEIKKFQTSSLITRTTNDVTQMEMLISMGLAIILKAPVMATWAIMKILNKGLEWSILTGAGVAILLLTIFILMLIALPKFKRIQKLIDKINGITRENLTGIRVIRAFNAEKFWNKRFENTNEDLTNTQLFSQRTFSIMMPIMNLVMHGLTVGIYIIGAILINKAMMVDKITLFSNMVVFTSYGIQVIMSFLLLAAIFMIAPRAQISANRINEVLEEPLSIKDGKFTDKTSKTGTVEFKNVSFKYPDADEYILNNISFKVEKGETIAFVGSTGSGKSTLIDLIPRFYDVTDGEILVDGVNVKDYKQEKLFDKIGYISQKAFMFTGTVEDNVTYGTNKKDNKRIKEAVKVAQAEEFVSKMAKKYNSHIARGGTNISGGQKQRLSIARAIYKNPEIYIFDDSFSALDYKTDATLREELKKYTKDATNIIVAQRIGTILNADKIIVLDKGNCVGIGTHDELLKKCLVYKEIVISQFGEEIVKNA